MTIGAFIPSSTATHVAVGGEKEQYPSGRFTGYALLACLITMLAALIVGHHIGVSGGIITMPQFSKNFVKESEVTVDQYCGFNDQFVSLFTSYFYLAGLVGVIIASILSSNCRVSGGTILYGAPCYCFGALYWYSTDCTTDLLYGTILMGIGFGFYILSVPLYLSEVAPYGYFPRSTKFSFQLMMTVGIFCTNLVNFGLSKINDGWSWKWSGVLGVFIMILTFIGSALLPNEPICIIKCGFPDLAKRTLQLIRGTDDIVEELNDLLKANRAILDSKQTWKTIFNKKYRPHLVMALAIPFFQQFTGINVIMFYGPSISKSLGMGTNASLIVSVITGGVILFGTLFGVAIADKVERKCLFIAGGVIMFVCEVVAGYDHGVKSISNLHTYGLLALLAVYLVGFACSWGLLGCLVPSEIFPLEIRLMGHCIMVGVSMFSTFIIAQYSLGMFCKFGFGIFHFFAAFILVMTVFVISFLPETKDIPIQEMPKVWGQHWFWRRYYSADDVHEKDVVCVKFITSYYNAKKHTD
ncbi:hypothetical protein AQUCO_00901028v1 [Aquilegia coerulea]|uniref:Major facilitator superfamily (MFS) profile domain-containing protein n=1 Tax=Aquilegia coerulea TaxID=218851 RepID=A0A2G5EGN7_AQUCA|nr:hypothetical protein AQUCO_00901028v1 [Aquilegia coerulea]